MTARWGSWDWDTTESIPAVCGNLTPQEIAIGAFLHIPEKLRVKNSCQEAGQKPRIPGVTLPYFVLMSQEYHLHGQLQDISHYHFRESGRSISGECCDVFFKDAHKARAFAQYWANRLPKECNGVLIRREQGEFKVSVPCA